MDRLPMEILHHIASFIPRTLDDGKRKRKAILVLMTKQGYQIPGYETDPPLVRPALATLSRRWQHAIEAITFRSIRLSSADLDDFGRIFLAESNPHRRPLLRSLFFTVVLPSHIFPIPLDDNSNWVPIIPDETDLDRQNNNRVTTKAIRALFDILSRWPTDATVGFSLTVQSPLENSYRSRDGPVPTGNYSYTRVLDIRSSPLPVLPCIKSFTTQSTLYWHLDPSCQVAIASRFPNAVGILLQMEEPGYFLGLRRELRSELAEALSVFRTAPATRKFDVRIKSPSWFPWERLPNLIPPPLRHDPVCSALHSIARNPSLESLYFSGLVEPSFFWPDSPEELSPRDPEPLWPALRTLQIEFNSNSPSGRWYFKVASSGHVPRSIASANNDPLPDDSPGHYPPGYPPRYPRHYYPGTNEWLSNRRQIRHYQLRLEPDDSVLEPLLVAFARALAQMPSLRTAWLRLVNDSAFGPDGKFSIFYAAPGEPDFFATRMGMYWVEAWGGQDALVLKPRVFFDAEDWRPSEALVNLFRWVGGGQHVEDVVIASLPTTPR